MICIRPEMINNVHFKKPARCFLTMRIAPHSPLLLRGLGTTSAESCYSSFAMNNRTACLGLSRLPSLTSFSGLWKCFTIPLMASPTPSWIWPVFNSGWEEKDKQGCCETQIPILVYNLFVFVWNFSSVEDSGERWFQDNSSCTTIIQDSDDGADE